MSLVSETQLPLSLAYPYSGVRVVLLLVSLTLVGRLERDRECVTAPPNAVPVTAVLWAGRHSSLRARVLCQRQS